MISAPLIRACPSTNFATSPRSTTRRHGPMPILTSRRKFARGFQCLVEGHGGVHSRRCLRPALSALGQSETNVTTEPWSAVEWIADADLTRASFYWDSVPHCRNPPRSCPVRGRAIPCSDCAKQRHDIIPNRLALTAEESVSG